MLRGADVVLPSTYVYSRFGMQITSKIASPTEGYDASLDSIERASLYDMLSNNFDSFSTISNPRAVTQLGVEQALMGPEP